jgi:DEAD/DEAH box helicase domain-containing protein
VDELDVDWESKVILEAHLQCAANEMPLRDEDEMYFGAGMKEICASKLIKDKEGW